MNFVTFAFHLLSIYCYRGQATLLFTSLLVLINTKSIHEALAIETSHPTKTSAGFFPQYSFTTLYVMRIHPFLYRLGLSPATVSFSAGFLSSELLLLLLSGGPVIGFCRCCAVPVLAFSSILYLFFSFLLLKILRN